MNERFYIYLGDNADRPHKENLTIDGVMDYIKTVELTEDDQKLKAYRPDIFDIGSMRARIKSAKEKWSISGWGEPAFAVARDLRSESQQTA